ncbi:MAG: methyltransferase domain-containing protein [Candidatus Woesearchaeota archaeon]
MKKLNLGCGKDYRNGWTNVDIDKSKKTDVLWDLNKIPYPFKENDFDFVLCNHTLEHLEKPISVMKEIWRVSKDKAIVEIYGPHFSSFTTYADLTHKRGLSYFIFGSHWNRDLDNLFKVKEKKLNFTRINFKKLNLFFNPIINLSPLLYERFFCWILPCSEIKIVLNVKKS